MPKFRIGTVNAKRHWARAGARMNMMVDAMLAKHVRVFSVNEINREQYEAVKARSDVGILLSTPNSTFPKRNDFAANAIIWDRAYFRRVLTPHVIRQLVFEWKYPLHSPVVKLRSKHVDRKKRFYYKHLAYHNPTRYNATTADRERMEVAELNWLKRQKSPAGMGGDANNGEPYTDRELEGRVERIAKDGPDSAWINLEHLIPTGISGTIELKSKGISDHNAAWGEVELDLT